MKMAAGWHFPVKVCMSAPLELQYVAYVHSKIELSGQNLLSVSHYYKPRQDSSISLSGFYFWHCSYNSQAYESKGNDKIAGKEKVKSKSVYVCTSSSNQNWDLALSYESYLIWLNPVTIEYNFTSGNPCIAAHLEYLITMLGHWRDLALALGKTLLTQNRQMYIRYALPINCQHSDVKDLHLLDLPLGQAQN